MGFGYGIDPKEVLYRHIVAGAEQYKKENSVITQFGDPILGFAQADHPLFDIFFGRDELVHPKAVYRPGNTVITHFLPFEHPLKTLDVSDPAAKKAWETAMKESIMLSLRINGIIREIMGAAGYTVSGTTTPGDWDPEKMTPEWNHRLAAYICGLGELSFGASFKTEAGTAGRFGGAITDYVMEPSREWEEAEVDAIRRDPEFYKRKAFSLDDQQKKRVNRLTGLCPADAVTPEGLDRHKCYEYCRTLEMAAPSQEACGRCWLITELD